MSRYSVYLLIQQRKNRRNSRTKKSQSKQRHRGFGILASFLVLLSLIPFLLGISYAFIVKDLPSVELLDISLDLKNGTFLNPTTIYDRTEKVVLYQLQNPGVPRRFLPIDPNNQEFFSPYLVQITVMEFEEDFWTSQGFKNNWFEVEGPNTIAEILVDRILLWDEPESTIRNIRMKILAAQITRKYGRTQVLEWFLNSQSYGHFTIGADSAARLYFNKPASQLTMAESALLVSISRTPALNPLDAPQAALENQTILLEKLVNEKKISKTEYQNAISERIIISEGIKEPEFIANAFTNLVLNQLYDFFSFKRIELGGINVVTSLDTHMQAALTCTLRNQIQTIKKMTPNDDFCEPAKFLSSNIINNSTTADFIGSAVVMNPKSGEILALLGDGNEINERNLIETHQGGSILTPLVALNAFARGYTLASQVWDIPNALAGETIAYAQSYEQSKGPMRLRVALANDYLTPISALIDQLGPDIVWKSARSFGIFSLSNETSPAILYEGKSANILEIAQLYATIANLGPRIGNINPLSNSIEPVLIKNVVTSDQILLYELDQSSSQSIVSSQLSFLIHDFLQDDSARRASLGYPNLLEIGRPAGAKFGHTNQFDEVWTAGYTPQFTTVVWFGNRGDSQEEINPQFAGNVWYAMMQWLHQDLAVESWSTPVGISEKEVCALSGLLATEACPELTMEKFIDGTQPVNFDNIFKSFEINRETGLLATVFTPEELIEKKIFMQVPDSALEWAKQTGVAIPPNNYDSIQSPNPNPNVQINFPKIYDFVHGSISIRGTIAGSDLKSVRIQIGSGLNPQSWFQVGEEQTQALVNGNLAIWNTEQYEDGLYALRLQVIRNDQTIETHTIQVTIDNSPPTINIFFPRKNDEILLSTNGVTTILADIQDGGGIDKVEWWLDGDIIGTTNSAPYSFPAKMDRGKHTLEVKAFDLAGNLTTSEILEFVIK